jgi:hypothetical protein
MAMTVFFVSVLWFLPSIGLCFSLNQPGLFAASLASAIFGVAVPWLAPVAIVGIGYGFHFALHSPPEHQALSFWAWLAIWAGGTLALQLAVWRSLRAGRGLVFPPLLPRWFRRGRLGWILPWLLPLLVFVFFEMTAHTIWEPLLNDDYITFVLWNVTALTLLMLISRRARLALIQMLAERSFAGVRSG